MSQLRDDFGLVATPCGLCNCGLHGKASDTDECQRMRIMTFYGGNDGGVATST